MVAVGLTEINGNFVGVGVTGGDGLMVGVEVIWPEGVAVYEGKLLEPSANTMKERLTFLKNPLLSV